jgi:hypothetical protein
MIVNQPFRGRLSDPPHKKIHSLWNRPDSLFLKPMTTEAVSVLEFAEQNAVS